MPRKRIPAPPDELLTSVEELAAQVDPDDENLPNQYRRLFVGGWTTAHQRPQAATKALAGEGPGDGAEAVAAATSKVRAAGLAHGLRAAVRCQAEGCGRPLTDPESVRRGIGPDCWRKGYRRRADSYLDDPDVAEHTPAPRVAPVTSWRELTIDEALAGIRQQVEGIAGDFIIKPEDLPRYLAERLADVAAVEHGLTEHRVDSYELVDGVLTVSVVGRRPELAGIVSVTIAQVEAITGPVADVEHTGGLL